VPGRYRDAVLDRPVVPAVCPDPPSGGPGRRVPAAALLVGLLVLLGVAVSPAPPVRGAQPAVASYRLEAGYDVRLHLHWRTRRVGVETTIALRNTSGGPVDRLELNTVAAKLGAMRDLRVTVDGAPVQPRVTGQTIVVPFGAPLAEAAEASVQVGFRATLRTSTSGRAYFFARLGDVAQLYRFIPWLSRTIRFGSQDHGEPFLTPNSPRVRVSVRADRDLVWATSGQQVGRPVGSSASRSAVFEATDVRDFNIAASPAWRTVQGTSRDGRTTIFAHTRRMDGRRLVDLARQELARYARLTGVPYPHATYRIAETGGGLPMESPALTWIPRTRGPADLPFLVSHETAHQWWYAVVGNDQSTNAFADEAVSDYLSRRAHLSLRPSRCPPDRLDRDIQAYSTACYYEVIYIQGGRFLDGLRRDFGAGPFRRALRAYTADNRLGIGGNARLLEALRAQMGDDVLGRFHRRFPSLY
jgi:hypothetical protein